MFYEYEQLHLHSNPIYVRMFVQHNSMGRIHWHEAIELLYFVKGTAITACNLQEYDVKPGTILLVNGNETHTGIISQCNSVFYCFQFDPVFFHNLIGNEYVIFENIIRDEDCTNLLDKLVALSQKKQTAANVLDSKKLSFELFSLLVERYTKSVLTEDEYKKQFKTLDRFNQILHYLDKHYSEDLSVSNLALQFNMSPSYFAHFFKRNAQKSVIEYVNEMRILHAKNILDKEDLSIAEIALRVGFSDINYFSRKFKALTGITPMKYKKDLRRDNKSQ